MEYIFGPGLLTRSYGILSGVLAGQPLLPLTDFLTPLPAFFLETLFNPSATCELLCNRGISLTAGGMGSRALQETLKVTDIAIPGASGQNKVGEVSGPREEQVQVFMGDPRCATGCIFCVSPVSLED